MKVQMLLILTQLGIFVQGVTNIFEIIEELLDLCPMKGATRRQDIFD